MQFSEIVDPFAAPITTFDFTESFLFSTDLWQGFTFEAEPQSTWLNLAERVSHKLPVLRSDTFSLDHFDLSLEDIDLPHDSPATTTLSGEDEQTHEQTVDQEEQGDLWLNPDLFLAPEENKLVSWDHFEDVGQEDARCHFISEASSAAFDLLLQRVFHQNRKADTKYVKKDILLSALMDLGLGLSSALFQWNEESQRFQSLDHNFTISGLSQDSMRSITNKFLDVGAQFRRLRQFGRQKGAGSAIKIALQTSIDLILDHLQDYAEMIKPKAHSLVALQVVYADHLLLLSLLDRFVKDVRSISNDALLLVTVQNFAEREAAELPQFAALLCMIVKRTIQPILEAIRRGIGSGVEHYELEGRQDVISAVLPGPAFEIFKRIKTTSQILFQNRDISSIATNNHFLKTLWRVEFDAGGIAGLQSTAQAYEQHMRATLLSDSISVVISHTGDEAVVKDDSWDYPDSNPFVFDHGLSTGGTTQCTRSHPLGNSDYESFRGLLISAFEHCSDIPLETITSCRQAIELSLVPLLEVEHRLLSFQALKMLFQHHNFALHINLLGRFQMLSDGVFVSKLSTALFSSEQFSGEGVRRMHTKTGLRLENRDTWPPATSELRLALMGILSESTQSCGVNKVADAISFAIRDLSDEDLECCRDIDSIHALDFLKLSYRAPNSLIEAVISESSHERYDRIFNQMLRLLRLQSLMQSMTYSNHIRNLHRTTTTTTTKIRNRNIKTKFRIEATHFITTLTEHYTTTIIQPIWSALESNLFKISTALQKNDYTGTLRLAPSGLEGLRTQLHDQALDDILCGLFLKRRQAEGKGIVDRLFEVILRFAALYSDTNKDDNNNNNNKNNGSGDDVLHGGRNKEGRKGNGNNDLDDGTTKTRMKMMSRLHEDFRMHVKALMVWLRGESLRRGGGGRGGIRQEGMEGRMNTNDMAEQLLLKLDWNGYWSR